MFQIMMNGNMSKIKYIVATPDKKEFYKVTEHDYDTCGIGGCSSTEYIYELVKTLDEATIFDKDPTSIMQRYRKEDWLPFVILKVRNIMELIDE